MLVVLLIDSTDHHRAAVFHQDLGLDVLGIDGGTGRRHGAHTVFAHVHFQADVPVRRDWWRDFQLEHGFAKAHGGGTAAGGHLVGHFGALLDQAFDFVKRGNTRAGNHFASAVGLQGGDFQSHQAIGGRAENGHGQAGRCKAALTGRRQIDKAAAGVDRAASR